MTQDWLNYQLSGCRCRTDFSLPLTDSDGGMPLGASGVEDASDYPDAKASTHRSTFCKDPT